MTTTPAPLSGYSITKVYSSRQLFETKDESDNSTDHGALRFGWDWRWVAPKVFEVKITVEIQPSATRRQYAYVDAIGQFQQVDEKPTIDVGQFVQLQAIAILLPYARQFLSAMTSVSAEGAFYLPSLNVAILMKGFDATKTTAARHL